jgi:hypothetical protein
MLKANQHLVFVDDENGNEHEAIAQVDTFVDVPGNPGSWDSDMDFYGYTEIEWHLIDPELDEIVRKDQKQHERIEEKLIQEQLGYDGI